MPPPPRRTKWQTFFVDTKSTCFLCLQEIPSKPVIPPPPPLICLDEEDDLDNDNNSSLSQEQVSIDPDSSEQQKSCPETGAISMRSIYKYLNVQPAKVISKEVSKGAVLGPICRQLNNRDIKIINLCKDCQQITLNLSNLCMELEILKMEVDHSLRTFVEVLKKSEGDGALIKNFRSQLEQPLDQMQGLVAELIRKETHKKGCRVLDKSIPRVDMNKVTTPSLMVPPTPLLTNNLIQNLITPANHKCDVCGQAFSSFSGLTQHKHKRHPNSVAGTLPSCMYCGMKLGTRATKADWIRHRLLHCGQRRAANANRAVQTTIKTETSLSHLLDPTRVRCNICGLSLKNKRSLYLHRLRIHHIGATSSHFLGNPNVTSDGNPVPITRGVGKLYSPDILRRRRFKCPDCGGWFVQKASMQRHQRKYCKMASTDKPVTCTTSADFPEIVNPSVTSVSNPPQSSYPIPSLPPTIVPVAVVPPQGRVGKSFSPDVLRRRRFRCPDCGDWFVRKASLQRHQQKHCKMARTDKLVTHITSSDFQEIVNPSLTSGGGPPQSLSSTSVPSLSPAIVPVAIPTNVGVAPRFHPDVLMRVDGLLKCADCGDLFVKKATLQRHQKKLCKKVPTETPVIRTNVVQVIPGENRYKCAHCDASFRHKQSLHRHRKQNNHFGNKKPEESKEQVPVPTPTLGHVEDPSASKFCSFCGTTFSTPFSCRRHQRDYCVAAKAAAAAPQSTGTDFAGIEIGVENDYFGTGQEIEGEEDEEAYQDGCLSTKVEVLEMPQIKISDVGLEGNGMLLGDDPGNNNNLFGNEDQLQEDQDHERKYVVQEADQQQKEEMDMMMILPDVDDPLQF